MPVHASQVMSKNQQRKDERRRAQEAAAKREAQLAAERQKKTSRKGFDACRHATHVSVRY